MSHDRFRFVVLSIVAAAIGGVGWSGQVGLLPLSTGFATCWSMARSRPQAGFISLVYFLAASRGLPQAGATYYSSGLWEGMLLWLAASLSFVIVHVALWLPGDGKDKAIGYLGSCVLMALPPFGIVGWAHPLTAAGAIFPTLGWLGLAATALALALMTTRYRIMAICALAVAWSLSASHRLSTSQQQGWYFAELELGASLGRDVSLERQHQLLARARQHDRGATVVYPESTIGLWTPTVDHFWRKGLSGSDVTVIAGAAVVDARGYDNVLVRITATESEVLYRQRMPVPLSMWQPWRSWLGQSGGARAYFLTNPVVSANAVRIAPLICYEHLLVWPVLQSMMHNPDLVVAVANVWWAEKTSVAAIQRASVEAWARLFDKPVIVAFNR